MCVEAQWSGWAHNEGTAGTGGGATAGMPAEREPGQGGVTPHSRTQDSTERSEVGEGKLCPKRLEG